MNKPIFCPAILLPMHSGPTVFLLSLTASVALYIVVRMFTNKRELFS